MGITKEFDATRANVVCSGRKASLHRNESKGVPQRQAVALRITFVFSYFFFPKPFSILHLLLGSLGFFLTASC